MVVGKGRTFALATLATVALVPAAHGSLRAPATTAPNVYVNIQVTITDTRITLDRHAANRGDEGRFVIRNVGKKRHNFTVGGAAPGKGVQTGFSATVNPAEQKILLLFFDYRGSLPYRSTIPADRAKPGMKGIFKIL